MPHRTILIIAAALLAVTTQVEAATLLVPKDHTSIQAAVDAAVAGDKIVVKRGLGVFSGGNSFDRNRISGSDSFDVRSTVAEAQNSWGKNNYKTSQFP